MYICHDRLSHVDHAYASRRSLRSPTVEPESGVTVAPLKLLAAFVALPELPAVALLTRKVPTPPPALPPAAAPEAPAMAPPLPAVAPAAPLMPEVAPATAAAPPEAAASPACLPWPHLPLTCLFCRFRLPCQLHLSQQLTLWSLWPRFGCCPCLCHSAQGSSGLCHCLLLHLYRLHPRLLGLRLLLHPRHLGLRLLSQLCLQLHPRL